MTLGQVSRTSIGLLLCAVILGVLLPGSLLAAPEGRARNYIVTLATADAGETIRLSNQGGRQRMRVRAALTRTVTKRLVGEYDIKTQHRYTSAISGFSARLTREQAATLSRDYEVARVRPARRFRLAGEFIPAGIGRVKASPVTSPTPDIDVDIAIIDTGIGPVGGNELNVVGGINCAADGLAPDRIEDLYPVGHGTHVAGIAAARDGNGVGVVGVAPGARLWAVRVFDQDGWGDESTVLCGLDWVTSTHMLGGAPPGTQPIEVINMSIEGSRTSLIEECLPGDPDPIHVAVCAADAAGITVVAAAGNAATDAESVVPAGYDQVITVGAISDFDGAGWGDAADDCSGERDDSYASYSNYGTDVDILAPGTCVESLRPSGTGDETKRLTGTSMAAPHVAGAVARYLATHPGTPPIQMRDLVRAAGRLDWDTRSDPIWSGVNDPDDPNRLLDVAALIGPPELRVWLSIDSFKVGAESTRRQARVDVQRGGGYGGDAQLSLTGLRAKVGSAWFDRPGTSLSGLDGLDARLNLRLETSAPDGQRELAVAAQGPAGSSYASRSLSLLIDRTGPRTNDLSARIRNDSVAMAANGATKAILLWTTADAFSTVRKSTLQHRSGSRPWREVSSGSSGSSAKVTLEPGRDDRFRVRSTDSLGNSALSSAVSVRLSVRDSSSPAWRQPARGWETKPARSAFGGSLLMADATSGKLTTELRGNNVAVVAPIGPRRGTFRLRVDGGQWQEVSLASTVSLQRRVVFSRKVSRGEHSLKIRPLTGHTAIDAIITAR